MPHMAADDRLKAMRQAEGETVRATLAPHFSIHRGSPMSHDYNEMHHLRAPKEDKRVYGRIMKRALQLIGVSLLIVLVLIAMIEAWIWVL